ncbi:LPXTG cell wall anchor domain-containing protein [Streptomyces acidiscabies]|uniref:DUF7507 domain-containing protein n=1 Tax=Streptomyces acidiscabies TaxID=42234 RepID=UPI0038F5F79D
MLAVLALLLSWLPPMGMSTAAAVPAGSEYPASWSVNGNTATGTTPSGVVVTATASGSVAGGGQGDVMYGGSRPSYLPSSSTAALKYSVTNCTNTATSGCGSVTYTFSRPVRTPVLYVADIGAHTGAATIASYHNHPITLASGTFSLDSSGSQSPRMGMWNSGQTVGIVNADQYTNSANVGTDSCVAFGCGAYDVSTTTATITSLTLYYSYAGTGTNTDGWGQILGITPATTSLSLTKSASPSQISRPGDTVTYSYRVTNTGEVPVTDPRINESSFSGTGTKPSVSCPTGTVGVGASVTCTVTYTATQADIDAGRISNTATATATPPSGMSAPVSNASTATVTASQNPALSVQKTVAETGDLNAGQTLHYSFAVRNTGNVTLSPVRINETNFTGSGGTPSVSCPNVALAPGTSLTCSATYTVTQADVDAGSISNTATASGTPPNNGTPVTSSPSTAVVPFTARPSLTVAKSADKTNVAVGDTITYSIRVTNTGNVTMRNVAAQEGDFSGSGGTPAVSCPAGASSLAPGASVTCTATYRVTQADMDAGKITNTATASGTPPRSSTPVTSPPSATTTVTTSQRPALAVTKSADRTDLVVGQTITYTYRATNTGNVTLTGVTVKETNFSGSGGTPAVSCPGGSLAPGASVTCTATYTVTQADVDAGKVTNSGTATGIPPGTTTPVPSPPSPTNTVTGTQRPALTVAKSTDRTDLVVGQTVTYSYRATNTGNVTITNLKVNESGFSGTGTLSPITCPSNWLAPGASVTCTATYTVTQADVDAGKLTNSATVSGTPPNTSTPITSPPGTTTVTGTQKPALTVVKSADKTSLVLGDTITYSFKVTNTGNVTMKNIAVRESDFTGTGTVSAISCPSTTLAPNATTTCTATYRVTQDDVDAGRLSNSATVTGVPPQGTTPVPPSSPSTTTIPGTRTPSLTVEKSADRTDLVAGQTVTYSFKVTNTGNVTLKDVAVQEGSFSGSGQMSAISCPAGASSLAPGAAVTCTATYVVTQADVDSGKLTNTATATGVPPGTTTPTTSPPSSPNTVTGTQKPGLSVTKAADKTSVVLGDVVTYTFTVRNTGNVTLTDVGVKEGDFSGTGKLSDITCPDGAKSLAPGASVTCTASYVVTQADVDAGRIDNSATPTGTPPGSTPNQVYPPGTTTVTGTPEPGLKVEKTADKTDLVVGETVTYSFKATNTGNVTLKDVTVKEDTFSGTGKVSAIGCPDAAKSLAPGASVTCTATYVVTQADVDAGKVTNSAAGTGVPPNTTTPITSPPSPPNTITGTRTPGLKVEKSADKTDLVVGETVTYSFKATNTGNVTLKNVSVQDADFSGTGKVSAIGCPDAAKSLAPGASVTCTATYVVTQADVDAGKLTNSATGNGVPPGTNTPTNSPPATPHTITGTQTPGLKVEKTADKKELVAGETITFSFKATNTGNVTLANITVREGDFNGTGVLSAPSCPDAAKSLAPGETVTCAATYVVTQADVDTGQLANSATVTGEPPLGGDPITSPPGTTKVPTESRPGLSVVKSADKTELVLGETITYSFVVTNTGNVTLKEVGVQEGEFTGSGTLSEVSCPDGAKSLAPGAVVTCTATYKVTQDDVDAGKISNSATATGIPPLGPNTPVTSPPGTTTVPTDLKPGLKVTKTASPSGKVKKGETITYSFLLANTGNVTLTEVRPVETEFTGTGKVSAIDCPDSAAKLIPGQRVTCTATYVVTEADAKSGKVSNAATGTARVPGGGEPPVPPTSTVTVTTEPPPTPELPDTGDDFDPLLIGLAVSLAAAGGGLLLAVRRRRGE